MILDWILCIALLCLLVEQITSIHLFSRDPPTFDNATGSTSDNTSSVCIKGVNVGSFIIDQPNRTSILVVGSFAIIRWHYTNLVKNPPQKLDVNFTFYYFSFHSCNRSKYK